MKVCFLQFSEATEAMDVDEPPADQSEINVTPERYAVCLLTLLLTVYVTWTRILLSGIGIVQRPTLLFYKKISDFCAKLCVEVSISMSSTLG